MSKLTVVLASEIKEGQVLKPHSDLINNFRVKSIETKIEDGNKFLIFRGDSITTDNDVFKCYPNTVVGLWDGDSLIEMVSKIKLN